MNRKKILYVLGGNYAASGMPAVITQKMNFLAENTDYELTALMTESPKAPMYYPLNQNIKVINFDINFDSLDTMPIYNRLWHYRKKRFIYKRKFTELLLNEHYDIVVSAMRREINFLTDIKDGSKKVGELHFNRSIYRVFNSRLFPQIINRAITSYWQNKLIRTIKKLDKFIVLSKEDAEAWGNLINMEIIPNPIKKIPLQISSCTNKKVIAVGRYTWQKGFDMLIEAWKIVDQRHPDWELHIYGSGDKDSYQRIAPHGVFCHESVKDIYSKYIESSIFAFSSRYEGFGLALAEAMSCGLPAVSFACPCGPKDIITDDGILVEPNDINNLANNICKLIEDESLRKKMGEKGHNNMKRYSEKVIMQKWLSVFDSLVM